MCNPSSHTNEPWGKRIPRWWKIRKLSSFVFSFRELKMPNETVGLFSVQVQRRRHTLRHTILLCSAQSDVEASLVFISKLIPYTYIYYIRISSFFSSLLWKTEQHPEELKHIFYFYHCRLIQFRVYFHPLSLRFARLGHPKHSACQ